MEGGGRGVAMPAGLVHIYIPTATIDVTDTLPDTANADDLPNVGGDPTANELIGAFRLITLPNTKYYAAAGAPSRITDEFTVLWLATTDVATAVNRIQKYTLGSFVFSSATNRFSSSLTVNGDGTATYQRSGILPDKDTVYDFAISAGNAGFRQYVNGICSGTGSSGVTDVTGALGSGIYYGRDNEGLLNSQGKMGALYVWSRALSPTEVENARLAIGRPVAA